MKNFNDVYDYVKNNNFDDARKVVKYATGNKLYHFFGNTDYFLSALLGERLYISRANQLNDPYDCLAMSDVIHEDLCEGMSKEDIYKSLIVPRERAKMIQKEFGTICFSRDYRNTVMWAHYADSHRGYCLEYRIEELSTKCRNLFPVNYSSTRATINMRNLTEENLLNCALTKHKTWKYEEEWRMIFFGNSEYNQFVENITPSSVLIGANNDICKDKRILKLMQYCEDKGIGLKLAALSDDEYGTKLIELK